jgi:hypothetical protein
MEAEGSQEPPLVPVHIQANPIYILPSFFFKIQFNIVTSGVCVTYNNGFWI